MKLFTLTVDGDTEVGLTKLNTTCHINASGDFGSGTLTIKISPDAGTTKTTLQDSSGNVAWTAANMVNFYVPAGYTIYLSLASSTSPDIDVWVGFLSETGEIAYA